LSKEQRWLRPRRVGRCSVSSNSIASGASIERPQTPGFVGEQQSRPALLLIVPSGRLAGINRDACFTARERWVDACRARWPGQAEAERERRAKVIHAECEHRASAKLSLAAAIQSQTPAAVQLRYLQTLSELGGERRSAIVFWLPLDLIRPMLETTGSASAASAPAGDDDRAALDPGPRDDACCRRGDSTPG
jgi:hypothetical protein